MVSRFWDVYRDIRSVIQRPDDALYILHTSIGAITVNRFVYRAEAGVVLLQGTDENGRERIAGFSEQQLSTFAFEIRMKSADKNGQIRLNPNITEERVREFEISPGQPPVAVYKPLSKRNI
jgi:hypothetical protein